MERIFRVQQIFLLNPDREPDGLKGWIRIRNTGDVPIGSHPVATVPYLAGRGGVQGRHVNIFTDGYRLLSGTCACPTGPSTKAI